MSVRIHVLLSSLLLLPAASSAQTTADFFNPDVVHRIDLLINSRDWEKLKADFQTNEYYPTDVRWNGVTVRNVGIRSRGLSTRSGTKPALRVDMNRYTTGQQFIGLKSFLLDNLVSDPSGIRERVAMRLYERMGIPAPRETHAELYINNTYAGVYGVIESIDKDFLARVFGETNGNTENDGYLFEFDFHEPAWYFNYLGSDLEPYRIRFDPTTHENASDEELYRPIEAMTRAVDQSPDATFVDSVAPYLDLPLFLRHVAVQTFLAQVDGILGFAGMANFHLYRFENSARSQFIPWDEDRAFDKFDRPILLGMEENVLMRRALGVPALRAAFFDALLETAAAATDAGWMEQEIARQRALIEPLMRADPLKPYSNQEFEATMATLAAFPRQRAEFVRAEVSAAR